MPPPPPILPAEEGTKDKKDSFKKKGMILATLGTAAVVTLALASTCGKTSKYKLRKITDADHAKVQESPKEEKTDTSTIEYKVEQAAPQTQKAALPASIPPAQYAAIADSLWGRLQDEKNSIYQVGFLEESASSFVPIRDCYAVKQRTLESITFNGEVYTGAKLPGLIAYLKKHGGK